MSTPCNPPWRGHPGTPSELQLRRWSARRTASDSVVPGSPLSPCSRPFLWEHTSQVRPSRKYRPSCQQLHLEPTLTPIKCLEVLQVSIELANLLTAFLQHTPHPEHGGMSLHCLQYKMWLGTSNPQKRPFQEPQHLQACWFSASSSL